MPDYPFGDEDATLMAVADRLRTFVGFDGDPSLGGLAVTDADDRTLVIVGGKGSGRSTYLIRARAAAAAGTTVYACEVEHNTPQTDLVHDVSELWAPGTAVEKWQLLWRAAILRAVASRVLYDDNLGRPLERTPEWTIFVDHFEPVLEQQSRPGRAYCPYPDSVYSQITAIVGAHPTRDDLAEFLSLDLWDKLEDRLAEILPQALPIALFLDSLDQEFRHAPGHWLTCQKALFYQVMRFSRNQSLAPWLRVVITLRDLAYSGVRESESATRYPSRGRIRVLTWGPRASREFLEEKVRRLPEPFLMRPNDEDITVMSWLGRTSIHNRRMRREEHIADYVLAHTRGSPRDIVLMGNELCRLVEISKARGDVTVGSSAIRSAVERLGNDVARESLSIAGAELASLAGDRDDLTRRFAELRVDESEQYRGSDAVQGALAATLGAVITKLGSQIVLRSALTQALEDELGEVDAVSVLWRNGLIGYTTTDTEYSGAIFHRAGEWDTLTIPAVADELVFHRCLIDLADLEPA